MIGDINKLQIQTFSLHLQASTSNKIVPQVILTSKSKNLGKQKLFS